MKAAVAELLHERQQEALAGGGRGRVGGRQPGEVILERRPGADEPVPGPRGRLAEALAALEPVRGFRWAPSSLRIQGTHPLQEIRRQQTAFGADEPLWRDADLHQVTTCGRKT